jgi:hypothetical protein
MIFIENLKKINIKKASIAILLIVFSTLGRIFRINFFPELYNIEPITVAALLAGAFLGFGYALIVPLAVIALTDMYIGNTSILFFTWSAWAIIGILGLVLKKSKKESFSFGFKMAGMGILASLFFFIWTNFGVWALSGMYAHTLDGLASCYVLALPFLKMNLLGNIIIVPVVSFTIISAIRIGRLFAYKKSTKPKKMHIFSN